MFALAMLMLEPGMPGRGWSAGRRVRSETINIKSKKTPGKKMFDQHFIQPSNIRRARNSI